MFRKIIRLIREATAARAGHDFSYESGERQVATDFADIRVDHRNRYEYAAKYMPSNGIGLDCFCGNGYGAKYLADTLHASVHGIDGSEEAILAAKQNFSDSRTTFEYSRFPFELEKDIYDFIVCLESLEHVKEDLKFLQTIVSSLKDGGHIALSVPNESALPYKLNKDYFGFHYKHYRHDELVLLAASTGLVFERLAGQEPYLVEDGRAISIREEHEMVLNEGKKEAQFLIYIFQKTTAQTESPLA